MVKITYWAFKKEKKTYFHLFWLPTAYYEMDINLDAGLLSYTGVL